MKIGSYLYFGRYWMYYDGMECTLNCRTKREREAVQELCEDKYIIFRYLTGVQVSVLIIEARSDLKEISKDL